MPLTDIQKVRLRIGDGAGTLFTDAEIQDFLDSESGVIDLAAALALESLAAAQAVKPSSTSTGTLSLSYNPQALLAAAARLRTRYEEVPATATAERNVSVFSEEEIVDNRIIRNDS